MDDDQIAETHDRVKKTLTNSNVGKHQSAMIRSKSFQMVLNQLSNSTMSSTGGKRLAEAHSPAKLRENRTNKSIEKMQNKESTFKKLDLPMKLYKSLANFELLKRISMPVLNFSFNKKKSIVSTKEPVSSENFLPKSKSKAALIAKELMTSLDNKRSLKPRELTSTMKKSKSKRTTDLDIETMERNHAIILQQMDEVREKLARLLLDHQRMREVVQRLPTT
jgi:hypothetical protein